MASIKVQPNLEVLFWAVKRSRVDLRSRFQQLDRWLSGEVQPTLRQLERFAKAANIPFGYLFLSQPPKESLPIPHFRTQNQQQVESPSLELLDTIYTMQQRQSWMRDYLVEQGCEPLPFIGSAALSDDSSSVA
jgi:transcriptional regulator with XRE-family HTH domain